MASVSVGLRSLVEGRSQGPLEVGASPVDVMAQGRAGLGRAPRHGRLGDRDVFASDVTVARVRCQEEPAIAVVQVMQDRAEPQQKRHPAALDELSVEVVVSLLPSLQALWAGGIALDAVEAIERAHDVAFPFEITLFDGVLKRERLELDAKAGHFGEVARGNRSNPVAAQILQLDQPVCDQSREGLAQGAAG